MVAHAELWLMETPNLKRRPVLIVTRSDIIPVLNNVVVAPVTSTIRDIPTCIPVGPEEGIDHDSVASFDNRQRSPSRCSPDDWEPSAEPDGVESAPRSRAMADC